MYVLYNNNSLYTMGREETPTHLYILYSRFLYFNVSNYKITTNYGIHLIMNLVKYTILLSYSIFIVRDQNCPDVHRMYKCKAIYSPLDLKHILINYKVQSNPYKIKLKVRLKITFASNVFSYN